MGSTSYIHQFEFFLLPFYLILIFWITGRVAKKYYSQSPKSIILYLAVVVKLIGSITFALMSQYFFKEGDTFMYFSAGLDIQKEVFGNFPSGINVLFMEPKAFGEFYEATFSNSNNYGYIASGANLFNAKISCFLSLLGVNGYLLTSLLYGLVAFTGVWQLFILFSRIFPRLTTQLAISLLFVPSILYWGGGVMKDTICLGAIGWLFVNFYKYFIYRERKIYQLILILLSFYVLYNLKIYIAGSIFVVLFIWLVFIFLNKIEKKELRVFVKYSIGGFLMLTTIFLWDSLLAFLTDNILESFSQYVIDSKKNYELTSSESAILTNIGEIRPDISSIISNIPAAINNALFRPYLWDGQSIIILAAGLENSIILIFTVLVLIKRNFSIFNTILAHPLITACFSFSIIFAIFIGLTCFNSGTMVRYKLPCVPFYCCSLVFLYYYRSKSQIRKEVPTQEIPNQA